MKNDVMDNFDELHLRNNQNKSGINTLYRILQELDTIGLNSSEKPRKEIYKIIGEIDFALDGIQARNQQIETIADKLFDQTVCKEKRPVKTK